MKKKFSLFCRFSRKKTEGDFSTFRVPFIVLGNYKIFLVRRYGTMNCVAARNNRGAIIAVIYLFIFR